jgi:hypothetical protein
MRFERGYGVTIYGSNCDTLLYNTTVENYSSACFRLL